MAIIPKPEFPNVPFLPGVPPVPRDALFAPVTEVVLGVEAIRSILWTTNSSTPAWGIYNDTNNLAVAPDNILAFDNRNEWRIQDFPVQNGAFASYNKIIIPFEVSVRLTKGGSQNDRRVFLDSIARIAGDLNLYKILTPERTYLDCNITRYEVTRRGAEGAYYLAEVDIFFRQILQVNAQYSSVDTNTVNAQQPAAQPFSNFGNQQPTSLTPTVTTQVSSAVAAQPN